MTAPKYDWARTLGLVTTIPTLILVATLIGLAMGWWLDGKLGTKPWLTIVLTLIGLAAGLYESAKMLIEITRDNFSGH